MGQSAPQIPSMDYRALVPEHNNRSALAGGPEDRRATVGVAVVHPGGAIEANCVAPAPRAFRRPLRKC